MKKKAITLTSIIGVLLLSWFAVVGIQQYNKNKKLREEGIRVEALVVNKEVLRSKTHSGKAKDYNLFSQYVIDLAVFIDTTKVKHIETAKKDKNISDKIDALFENSSLNLNPSEYYKVRTAIDVSNYKDISTNQWVTYVYLKDDPEGGRLLMELE